MTGSSQRMWLNLVLLLVLVVVGGVGYWAWQQEQKANELVSLLPLKRSELQSIVIERYLNTEKPERIEFKGTGEQWFMVQPYAVEANPVKMTQLTTLPIEQVQASYDIAGKDLATFGLKPISIRLKFNEYEVGFGNSNPVNQQRYLLVNNRLVLVSEVVSGLINGSTVDLVARTLIPTNATIKEIVLPDGSQQTGVSLLNQWRSASAILVEPSTTVKSTEQIHIRLTNNKEITFIVERTAQDLKLTNPAVALTYTLPLSWADSLLKPAL